MENKDILDVGGKFKIEYDEARQCIVISTPQNNCIEISDEAKQIRLTDQSKNEIVMNQSGITLNSSRDLILKARNNIVLEAGMKADVKAKSDISIEGMNVNVTAKIGLMAKGNAKAELSASGQTVVKGALVMIN